MAKGRATATFTVESYVIDSELTIRITVPVGDVEYNDTHDSANGTVALGKLVAELGKVATPISSSERKLAAMAGELVSEGLSLERALEIAKAFS